MTEVAVTNLGRLVCGFCRDRLGDDFRARELPLLPAGSHAGETCDWCDKAARASDPPQARHEPAVPVDVRMESAYGRTSTLPFAVRVF